MLLLGWGLKWACAVLHRSLVKLSRSYSLCFALNISLTSTGQPQVSKYVHGCTLVKSAKSGACAVFTLVESGSK